MGSPLTPNFTSAPAVGPEPANFFTRVRQSVFGAPTPPPPDPYTLLDDAAAVKLLTDTKAFCETGRELFEYGWWRNLLYLLNRQWIFWVPGRNEWRDKRLARWIPKPVTNIVRTTVLSIRATVQAIDLGVAARPNGRAPKNVTTAQTVDDLEPLLKAEHKVEQVWQEADYTTILFGNSYLHVFWDKDDPANTTEIDQWTCALCSTTSAADDVVDAGQKCPGCGSPDLSQGASSTAPIGKGCTLVATPLEVLLPIYAQSFEHVDRLIHLTWTPRHQIEDELSDRVGEDGQPVLAHVAWDKGPQSRALQMYKALATTSDLSQSSSPTSTGSYTGQVEGITELRLWMKPTRTYPKGVYLRFLGESNPTVIREVGSDGQPQPPTLPYVTKMGKPLWPWVDYPFEAIKGRLYAQSAVDCIISKQDQLNQNDSMVQMSVQRMGNPIWLEEKGANVERFTGEPGLVVKWQRVGPQGGKPERIPGENPPASMFTIREQLLQDVEDLTGTSDILKGQKPANVEAFSALQLLVERSQSRFTTFFKARGTAYQQWYALVVELERSYGPTQRVQSVLGPNKNWTFKTFEKANLDGDIDLHIEDGTNVPKTALGRRAAIEHGSQLQIIHAQDSEQQFALLDELGLSDLAPSLSADVSSALQEQAAFEEWVAAGMAGPPPLVRLEWQSDPIHLVQNRLWMNGDAVRQILTTLPPDQAVNIRQLLANHLAEHSANIVRPPIDLPKVTLALTALDLTNPLVIEVLQATGLEVKQVTGAPTPAGPTAQGVLARPGAATPPSSTPAPGHATPKGAPGTPPPAPGHVMSPGVPGAARALANSNQNAGSASPVSPNRPM